MRRLHPLLLAALTTFSTVAATPIAAYARPADEEIDSTFHAGFAVLKSHLGEVMGEAIETEHPDPNGSGDTHQQTTTGLAVYHPGSAPVFFDGYVHYTWLPQRGEVRWVGDSFDPPPPEPVRIVAGPAAAEPALGIWDRLAECESNGRWGLNTGNGFMGGLQFDRQTWLAYGGGQYAPRADLATRAQQISIAQRLQAARGFGPWPACSRRLGLR